jgi:hypothetical protein
MSIRDAVRISMHFLPPRAEVDCPLLTNAHNKIHAAVYRAIPFGLRYIYIDLGPVINVM